ncbi:hypothetical protein EV178_004297 [Coemansia sp. RSA 1646]|nr:hypothetical protein EV178_004297 [Coemansia sp. RSA 1646]KAJ2088845.1 hypothetical protein IW138_003917 [Coemansia sp. RSA 986]
MEVAISPITLDVTKQLARLYPPPSSQQSTSTEGKPSQGEGGDCVLDNFFAADFIPPRVPKVSKTGAGGGGGGSTHSLAQQLLASFDNESYGVKYVRYLHQFAFEQYLRFAPTAYSNLKGGIQSLADVCAAGIVSDLAIFNSSKWDPSRIQQQQQVLREKILAHTIITHACIEQSPGLEKLLGKRVAVEFWASKLPSHLWRSIRIHLAQCAATASASDVSTSKNKNSGGSSLGAVVKPEELEVAVELLFLFSSLAKRTGIDIASKDVPGLRSVQRVCLAVELFSKYSKHSHWKRHHHHHHHRRHSQHGHQGPTKDAGDQPREANDGDSSNSNGESVEVGKLQRIRLGHKSLLLVEVTWGLLLGDEADSLRRINNGASGSAGHEGRGAGIGAACVSSARSLKDSGLARDALRQIHELIDKYPLLADDVREDVEKLLPFVHPFDGHLTRTAQLSRFGPIPALKQRSRLLSLSLPPSFQQHVPGAQAASAAAATYANQRMRSLSSRMLLVDSMLQANAQQQHQQQHQQQNAALHINGFGVDGMVHPDLYLPQPASGSGERKPWFSKPPRAARECISAYVASVRMTRSEREYSEWWRRLVQERGMPLSLTLNAPGRKGMNSDITINYDDHASSSRHGAPSAIAPALYEFCGVVEAEDLPALEKLLDEDDTDDAFQWPSDTDVGCESADAHNLMYRALFPLLPALCKAIVLTIVNWSPTEKEFPSRQFLINVGLPQVSDSTCLGIIKYPRQQAAGKGSTSSRGNSANDGSSSSSSSSGNSNDSGSTKDSPRPTSPLSGSNVKRLERTAASSTTSSSSSSNAIINEFGNSDAAHDKSSNSSGGGGAKQAGDSPPPVPTELGARLIAQYAQWQAIGGLLMRLMLGLQANHVLQADYAAQLLMNENLIPAMFWWMGTANLDYCSRLPPSVATHTFMSEYIRHQHKYFEMTLQKEQTNEHSPSTRNSSKEGADPAAVGRDISDSEEASGSQASAAASVGPSIESMRQTADIPLCADPPDSWSEKWQCLRAREWKPALEGLDLCMRSLRRLTSHNGLRKGLLYKNKALYFYSRLFRVPCTDIQRTAAELYRDIMPVVSKKQKQAILDSISLVYLHGPVSLGDTFWLADYSLDPQIEMHRHVELLRLLHFYHFEAFGLRLPRDPALFPSLVNQAIVEKPLDPALQSSRIAGKSQAATTDSSQSDKTRGKSNSSSSHRQRAGSASANGTTAHSPQHTGKQSGAAVGEYSWLLWESDLEDTLNEVYSSSSSHRSVASTASSTASSAEVEAAAVLG